MRFNVYRNLNVFIIYTLTLAISTSYQLSNRYGILHSYQRKREKEDILNFYIVGGAYKSLFRIIKYFQLTEISYLHSHPALKTTRIKANEKWEKYF